MSDTPLNLQKNDLLTEFDSGSLTLEKIHIRVTQRNNKKRLTTLEGLPEKLPFEKLLKALRKKLCCNGSLIEHKDLGNIIQLQGDHRQGVKNFLIEAELARAEEIKVHGIQ